MVLRNEAALSGGSNSDALVLYNLQAGGGALPLLARGWRPRGKRRRNVNQTSRRLVIRSAERIFTLDGEIFESRGTPLTVEVGPTVELAMYPGTSWT